MTQPNSPTPKTNPTQWVELSKIGFDGLSSSLYTLQASMNWTNFDSLTDLISPSLSSS